MSNTLTMSSFFPNVRTGPKYDHLGRDWRMNISFPPVNIAKEESHFNITVIAPGFEKEDFKLEIKNGKLIISAERKDTIEEKTKEYLHQEYEFHSFKRVVMLPVDIDFGKIDAYYKDGILRVTIPKMFKSLPEAKQIPVNS